MNIEISCSSELPLERQRKIKFSSVFHIEPLNEESVPRLFSGVLYEMN